MKKVFFYILGTLSITTVNLQAEEISTKINTYDISPMLETYYKKGLADGSEKAYKEGFKSALLHAKKRLRLWENEISNFEKNKYLLEYDGKITNPEIYQSKFNMGEGVNVIVDGCKIEKQLTPDDIIDSKFFTHKLEKDNYYNITSNTTDIFNNSVTNGVDIISRDKNGFNEDRPSSPFGTNKAYLYLAKNKTVLEKLNVLNYAFAIENNRIKIILSSEKEKQQLLKKLGMWE